MNDFMYILQPPLSTIRDQCGDGGQNPLRRSNIIMVYVSSGDVISKRLGHGNGDA